SLTAQQPYNNVVRVTLQALAAVMGGTNSLHTNSLDETLALPTERSARIALRTQQIIAHESGVINTIDPFGGSFFIEELTDQMEKGAFEYFEKIDSLGGMVEAIEAGFPQKEVWDASYRYQMAIDSKEKIIVGVNDLTVEDDEVFDTLYIDEAASREQLELLAAVKARRDGAAVERTLAALKKAAESETENTMPYFVDCVKAYATVGEISVALREVFGTYTEPALF
ncbi:MAG: methylmalonyl-CoA mutase family protein, partial [Thermoanaerobaculia bacterium]|nr:methylmalonyl-CoA mutase family protein [Thermoanaerobaculia bacterium]